MIPNADMVKIGQDVEIVDVKDWPSRTYAVNWQTGRVAGFVDGREAIKQAILKILHTERFAYLIYSWNYGIELNAAFGKSYQVFSSEIKRVLREALLQDRRITELRDMEVRQNGKRTAEVSFTAVTVFGDVEISEGVEAYAV